MLKARVKIDASGIEGVVSEAKKRNITVRGAKAAAKILKVAARGEAPKRSGATKRAQAVKAAKGTRGSTASYAVQGVKKKFFVMWKPKGRTKPVKVVPAFIDHLIQLGTKPHGKHPGARANPYRKRAWHRVKGPAGSACLAEMGKATQKEIARQAAKIAAKAGK